MRLLPSLLLALIIPCSAFGQTSVSVQDKMMAKSVDTSGCIAPTPVTTFLASDSSAYVWFQVSGANTGDVPSAKWYSPDGSLYTSSSWAPVASSGSWCYWGWISITGHGAASLPGKWTVEVDWNGGLLFTLPFNIVVPGSAVPQISSGGVVNAASFAPAPAPVAGGSIAAIFGANLANGTALAPAVPLPTKMNDAQVIVNGIPAPLFFVSPGQINVQIPWEAGSATQLNVQVTVNGLVSNTVGVNAAGVAPGCFTMNQAGQGAILIANTDAVAAPSGSIPGRTSRPAVPGDYLSLYCTGLGRVSNRPASGAPAPSSPLSMTLTTPTAMIGNLPADVTFSGLTPGLVGLNQINIRVPDGAPAGDAVPVAISIGGATSNTVTMAVQLPPITTTPGLSSVSPNSASAGQVLTVALNGTNFVQNQTLANFGAGISVAGAPEGQPGTLTVASPSGATARLTIDPLAATGARTVTVTTGAQTASLNSAFTVLAAPAPMGPLSITSTSPANGAAGVSLTPTIRIAFNEPLDPSTVGPSTVSITNETASVPATMVYDSARYEVSMSPNGALRPGTVYTGKVGALLRNAAGNSMGTAYSFVFTTVSPITVTGTITPTPGLDPRTLTVLSYGGKASTPDSNGNFSAAISPAGYTLVAAVFPGKTFALLGVLNNGGTSVAHDATDSSAQLPGSAASPLLAPQVHRTRWQITASTAAAASPNPVLDYQTTAETFVFMSPYLYTQDLQKSSVTQQAVAQSLSTKQLAATLQSTMTGANTPAEPMTVAAIQSAMHGAIQDTLNSLFPLFATPTNANSTPPTILDLEYCPSPPATVRLTPYCKTSSAASSGELPCLDLDYISFCDAVHMDQGKQTYTFAPRNCTDRAWGCAVGWLARFAPIADQNEDPAGIGAKGSNGSMPESPAGHTTTCSPGACWGAWISGNSAFAKADVFGAFSDWVTSLIVKDSSGSLVLQKPGNYIARFYSGGLADPQETANITADAYTDGASLSALATGVNMAETALNIADMAFDLAPGPTTAAEDVARCALLNITGAAVEAAAGQAAGTVSGGVKAIADLGNSILKSAASCVVSQSAQSLFKLGAEALLASTGVGVLVDVAVNGAGAAANAAEALQRSYELKNKASALETAVIQILPGSVVPNNPVPKITSLTPSSAPAGASSQAVTIRGTNFLRNSTVAANNAPLAFTFGSDGSLTTTLNSSDLATAGTFQVTVTNPEPGGGTSKASFTVTGTTSSNPQPRVTSLFPSSAAAGTSSLVLSICGKNFLPNSAVTFNGLSRAVTTPYDAGQLTITLSASDLAKTGVFPVTVTNPGPGNLSSSFNFSVLDPRPSQPAVTSMLTNERVYVAGDQFTMSYTVLAGMASGTFDLMIAIQSLASGNTYYYYDDASDPNSRWLHTTPRAASTGIPQTGRFTLPADPSAFQVTNDVPAGDYHVKAYFSKTGGNQPVGAIAEADFSVATTTPAGTCFVATAAFGSPMAGQVQCLRVFRDRILLSAGAGRAFVNWYYGWSPRAAAWLRGHSIARKLTRAILWIPVLFAWLSLRTSVALALLGFLVLLSSLGWSLRRGPAWWRVLCLLVLAIWLASASDWGPGQPEPTPRSFCANVDLPLHARGTIRCSLSSVARAPW